MAKKVGLSIYGMSLYSSEEEKNINLNNLSELKINEDITEQVRIDGGIPTYNSLKIRMLETAHEYLKLLGFIV